MGLRELKAARTKRQIVDIAYTLFIEQGYDETTMEQIAERAEIGSSTLYRYFPSKDLLILDRLTAAVDLATALEARPADEPIAHAISHALLDALEGFDDDPNFPRIRKVIDNAPVPRARLWDVVMRARERYEHVLAARMRLAPDDLHVVLTARLTFLLWEITAERWWSGDRSASRPQMLDEVLRALHDLDIVLPEPLSERVGG
jgi:AcrR family transcriptional regulator